MLSYAPGCDDFSSPQNEQANGSPANCPDLLLVGGSGQPFAWCQLALLDSLNHDLCLSGLRSENRCCKFHDRAYPEGGVRTAVFSDVELRGNVHFSQESLAKRLYL